MRIKKPGMSYVPGFLLPCIRKKLTVAGYVDSRILLCGGMPILSSKVVQN